MKSFKSKSDDLYDEFYASVKLISGEEVLCLLIVDKTTHEHIIMDNPVVCEEIRSPGTNAPVGYKFEPWMKLTDEQCFLLETSKVITISEIKDDDIIETYKHIVNTGFKQSHPDISKEMGYVSSVDDARALLEKLYKAKSN
jgi:hypothetical protein